MEDFSNYQDIFGQLRLLKSYSHILLCFPVADSSLRESITEALESATVKVTAVFPWLTGKVINEGSGPGNSGLFKIASCPRWAPPNTILRVKDCSDECPSYAEILKGDGSPQLLDPEILAPCVAFPQSYQETESDPACVAAIQANFIEGGLLLDFACQHNMMDASGMLQFVHLVAKAMHGEEFLPVEIKEGNQDRRNMVRLLGPDEPFADHSNFQRPSLLKSQKVPQVPAHQGEWCFFRFTAQKLAELKSIASDPAAFDPSVSFISTNDAVTAFIWKRISAARLRRLNNPDAFSKFTRAVDVRSTLGVAPEYMGHMVYNSFSTLTFQELDQAPLSFLASLMRKNLKNDVTEHAVRSFVTLLANTPDKTTLMYGGDMNKVTDVGFTSIAHSKLYSADFGIIGKTEMIRRPHFIPKTTTVYLFPKTESGDIESLICVSEEDMKELKADEEWSDYAKVMG
ncbi:hypothetical protein V490_02158 [Pseudogymnoascus sp. VKM F-3557]|nr:hypothetical protein V490_02158 [Pseudogymnoascus sp. VKM F-3557]